MANTMALVSHPLHRLQYYSLPIYVVSTDNFPFSPWWHLPYSINQTRSTFNMSITNDEEDTESQAFLPRDSFSEGKTLSDTDSTTWKHYRRYLRIAVEIFMAVVILILSIQIIYEKDDEKRSRSPVPNCMSTIL